MSVKDFKAGQLRTSKIIGSGSLESPHKNGAPGLLIYSASSATNYEGGIDIWAMVVLEEVRDSGQEKQTWFRGSMQRLVCSYSVSATV